ncbi:MAG: MFS transporter [Rickettsiaceae bacterium]|nr:MFS transporter [Rickettsiaceae bacterium]
MKIKRIIVTGALANIFEWYDYSLFGSLAYLIGEKFFAAQDLRSNILNAFMIFAVGYIMRPLGGAFFGMLGDRLGRKFSLVASVMFMSVPTALVGLMPTYNQIGIYSTIALVFIRMLQGLSMGGLLTGSIAFLVEHSPKNRKGLIASITATSICVGILLGNFICFLITLLIGESEFHAWGWRVPFLLGGLNIFVGFYIIYKTEETPEYKVSKENIPANSISYVFANHLSDMLVSIFINAPGSVMFYFQVVFVINFLKLGRILEDGSIYAMESISLVAMGIFALIAGYASDIFERRKLMQICAIISFIASFPIIYGIESGNIIMIYTCQILLAILVGIYLGIEPALQAEFYPAKIRYTALSISYNTSTSIFGGATPLIISYLYDATNSLYVFSLYLFVLILPNVISLGYYKPVPTNKKSKIVK